MLNWVWLKLDCRSFSELFAKAQGPWCEYTDHIVDHDSTILYWLLFRISFDTSMGGLTLADQFLMISTKLPTRYLYGFGENTHDTFLHDMNYRMWPIFARDQAPDYVNIFFILKWTWIQNESLAWIFLLLRTMSISTGLILFTWSVKRMVPHTVSSSTTVTQWVLNDFPY